MIDVASYGAAPAAGPYTGGVGCGYEVALPVRWVMTRRGDRVADAQNGSVYVIQGDAPPRSRRRVVPGGVGGDLPCQGGGDRAIPVQHPRLGREPEPGGKRHRQAHLQGAGSGPGAARAGGKGRTAVSPQAHPVDELVRADLAGSAGVAGGLGTRDAGVEVADDRRHGVPARLHGDRAHRVGQRLGTHVPLRLGLLGALGRGLLVQQGDQLLDPRLHHRDGRPRQPRPHRSRTLRIRRGVQDVEDVLGHPRRPGEREVGVGDQTGLDEPADLVVLHLGGPLQDGGQLRIRQHPGTKQQPGPRQAAGQEHGGRGADPLIAARLAHRRGRGDLGRHQRIGQSRGVQALPDRHEHVQVVDHRPQPPRQRRIRIRIHGVFRITGVTDRRTAGPSGE